MGVPGVSIKRGSVKGVGEKDVKTLLECRCYMEIKFIRVLHVKSVNWKLTL